nr:vegetative cell wall protein gp1-like [Aegilops tauschii subsp. strangulata]
MAAWRPTSSSPPLVPRHRTSPSPSSTTSAAPIASPPLRHRLPMASRQPPAPLPSLAAAGFYAAALLRSAALAPSSKRAAAALLCSASVAPRHPGHLLLLTGLRSPQGPRSPRPPARSPSPPLDPARLPLLLPAPPPDQAGLRRPCPSSAGPLQQGPVPTSGVPSSPPPCHGRVAPDLLLPALGAAPPDLPVALVDDQRCPCSLPSSASSPPDGAAPGLPHHYHLQPRLASTLVLCSASPPLLRPASTPPLPSSAPPLLRQGTPAISCSSLAFAVRAAASLLQAKADAGHFF